jgi:transcriptional regulator with XRE-family HTH domain
MPDNFPLIRQLANRARSFHRVTGTSQSRLAEAIDMAEGNYSNFLNGKSGISAEATCKLLRFTNMPREQAIALFSRPVRSSQIMNLQERGKAMHFDNSGWVPGLSGIDPNNSTDITNTSDAVTKLLGVFGGMDFLTRQTVVDQLTQKHASLPTDQKFSRKAR